MTGFLSQALEKRKADCKKERPENEAEEAVGENAAEDAEENQRKGKR